MRPKKYNNEAERKAADALRKKEYRRNMSEAERARTKAADALRKKRRHARATEEKRAQMRQLDLQRKRQRVAEASEEERAQMRQAHAARERQRLLAAHAEAQNATRITEDSRCEMSEMSEITDKEAMLGAFHKESENSQDSLADIQVKDEPEDSSYDQKPTSPENNSCPDSRNSSPLPPIHFENSSPFHTNVPSPLPSLSKGNTAAQIPLNDLFAGSTIRSQLQGAIDGKKMDTVQNIVEGLLKKNETLLAMSDAGLLKPNPRRVRAAYDCHARKTSQTTANVFPISSTLQARMNPSKKISESFRPHIIRPKSPTLRPNSILKDKTQFTYALMESSICDDEIEKIFKVQNHEIVCGINSRSYLADESDKIVASLDLDYFWCNFCPFSTSNKPLLIQHALEHRFKCKFCAYESFCRSDVVRHMHKLHSDFSELAGRLSYCTLLSDYLRVKAQAEGKENKDPDENVDDIDPEEINNVSEELERRKRKIETGSHEISSSAKAARLDSDDVESSSDLSRKSRKSQNPKRYPPPNDSDYDMFEMEVEEISESPQGSAHEESESDRVLYSSSHSSPNPHFHGQDGQPFPTGMMQVVPGIHAQSSSMQTSATRTKPGQISTVGRGRGRGVRGPRYASSSSLYWSCGYCTFQSNSQSEIKEHSNRAHPGKPHRYVALIKNLTPDSILNKSPRSTSTRNPVNKQSIYSTGSSESLHRSHSPLVQMSPTSSLPHSPQVSSENHPTNGEEEIADTEDIVSLKETSSLLKVRINPVRSARKENVVYRCYHCTYTAKRHSAMKSHIYYKHRGKGLVAVDDESQPKQHIFFCARDDCTFKSERADLYLHHVDQCTPWSKPELADVEVEPHIRECLDQTVMLAESTREKEIEFEMENVSNMRTQSTTAGLTTERYLEEAVTQLDVPAAKIQSQPARSAFRDFQKTCDLTCNDDAMNSVGRVNKFSFLKNFDMALCEKPLGMETSRANQEALDIGLTLDCETPLGMEISRANQEALDIGLTLDCENIVSSPDSIEILDNEDVSEPSENVDILSPDKVNVSHFNSSDTTEYLMDNNNKIINNTDNVNKFPGTTLNGNFSDELVHVKSRNNVALFDKDKVPDNNMFPANITKNDNIPANTRDNDKCLTNKNDSDTFPVKPTNNTTFSANPCDKNEVEDSSSDDEIHSNSLDNETLSSEYDDRILDSDSSHSHETEDNCDEDAFLNDSDDHDVLVYGLAKKETFSHILPVDGGFPHTPAVDGGFPHTPAVDGGFPHTPAVDGGFPHTSAADGGFSHTSNDGGFPLSPAADGGFLHTPNDGGFPHTPAADGSCPHTPAVDGDFSHTPAAGSCPHTPAVDGDLPHTPAADGGFPHTPDDGGFTNTPAAEGGFSHTPPADGGFSQSPAAKGGCPQSPAAHGGCPPSPAAHGGCPQSPAAHGGFPHIPAAEGGCPHTVAADVGCPHTVAADGGFPHISADSDCSHALANNDALKNFPANDTPERDSVPCSYFVSCASESYNMLMPVPQHAAECDSALPHASKSDNTLPQVPNNNEAHLHVADCGALTQVHENDDIITQGSEHMNVQSDDPANHQSDNTVYHQLDDAVHDPNIDSMLVDNNEEFTRCSENMNVQTDVSVDGSQACENIEYVTCADSVPCAENLETEPSIQTPMNWTHSCETDDNVDSLNLTVSSDDNFIPVGIRDVRCQNTLLKDKVHHQGTTYDPMSDQHEDTSYDPMSDQHEDTTYDPISDQHQDTTYDPMSDQTLSPPNERELKLIGSEENENTNSLSDIQVIPEHGAILEDNFVNESASLSENFVLQTLSISGDCLSPDMNTYVDQIEVTVETVITTDSELPQDVSYLPAQVSPNCFTNLQAQEDFYTVTNLPDQSCKNLVTNLSDQASKNFVTDLPDQVSKNLVTNIPDQERQNIVTNLQDQENSNFVTDTPAIKSPDIGTNMQKSPDIVTNMQKSPDTVTNMEDQENSNFVTDRAAQETLNFSKGLQEKNRSDLVTYLQAQESSNFITNPPAKDSPNSATNLPSSLSCPSQSADFTNVHTGHTDKTGGHSDKTNDHTDETGGHTDKTAGQDLKIKTIEDSDQLGSSSMLKSPKVSPSKHEHKLLSPTVNSLKLKFKMLGHTTICSMSDEPAASQTRVSASEDSDSSSSCTTTSSSSSEDSSSDDEKPAEKQIPKWLDELIDSTGDSDSDVASKPSDITPSVSQTIADECPQKKVIDDMKTAVADRHIYGSKNMAKKPVVPERQSCTFDSKLKRSKSNPMAMTCVPARSAAMKALSKMKPLLSEGQELDLDSDYSRKYKKIVDKSKSYFPKPKPAVDMNSEVTDRQKPPAAERPNETVQTAQIVQTAVSVKRNAAVYMCGYCLGISEGSLNKIKPHVLTKHSSMPPMVINCFKQRMHRQCNFYICPQLTCSRLFSREKEYEIHKRSHGEESSCKRPRGRPRRDSYAPKEQANSVSFSEAPSVKSSIKTTVAHLPSLRVELDMLDVKKLKSTIRPEEKKYLCLYCTDYFYDSSLAGMKSHYSKEHAGHLMVMRDTEARKAQLPSRIYVCEMPNCECCYINRPDLDHHSKSHKSNSTYIYECACCGWYSSSHSGAVQHLRSQHRDESNVSLIHMQVSVDEYGQTSKKVL